MPSSSGFTRTVKPKKPISAIATTAISATKGSAHAAARHGLTDAVLAAAQDLLKIRLLAGSLWDAGPRDRRHRPSNRRPRFDCSKA
jgi:hypothetical protein